MLSNKLDPIIVRFQRENWNAMTREQRLATLQEFENHMAAMQGRPATKVHIMSDEYRAKNPGTRGYQCKEGLFLGPEYFQPDTFPIPGMNEYSPARAMNTLLHEGRHAWQHRVVDKGNDVIAPAVRAKLDLSFQVYTTKQPQYFAQPVEVDARRYAMHTLAQIAARIEQLSGEASTDFQIVLRKLRNEELSIAASIKRDLDVDQLKQLDDLARQRFIQLGLQKKYPGVGPGSLSLYGEGLDILTDRLDFDDFADQPPFAIAAAAFEDAPDEDGEALAAEADPDSPEGPDVDAEGPDAEVDAADSQGATDDDPDAAIDNIFDLIDAEGQAIDLDVDALLEDPEAAIDAIDGDSKTI